MFLNNDSIQERLENLISAKGSTVSDRKDDQFKLGVKTKEGRKKRREWLALEETLTRIQGLTSLSVQRTSLAAQQNLLNDLRSSIVSGCYYLVAGKDIQAQPEHSGKF